MARLPVPNRDSLGWLIPILLLAVFYGAYLFFNTSGFLSTAGALLCATGIVGLSYSRRVRRLVAYITLPKTAERREQFAHEVAMDYARRLARKEKIPELVTNLYFGYFMHLPSLMSREVVSDEIVIPPLITAAQQLPGNRTLIVLSGKEYIFTFVQYVYSTVEGERDMQATLQIACDNKKLILLHLVPITEEDAQSFRPISIEYVIMTDWVNDFKHLVKVITEEKERRRHEDRLN